MSAESYVDPDSVDLTEDEQSSDGHFSQQSSPLHFVDCSKAADPVFPDVSIDSHNQVTSIKSTLPTRGPTQLGCKNVPNILKKRSLKRKPESSEVKPKNPIGKFTSVQIRPPSGIIPETQEADSTRKLETVCLDSDEDESLNILPEQQNVSDSCNSTIYSTRQPGKVVIIKKNNKYYKIVIPHNVMPDVNQSVGPVLINIPEVGPLVITTDPQVTKSNVAPKPQFVQQLLNLDDMDQRQIPLQNNVPQKKINNAPSVNAREAVLCDKKFCWTYIKNRKRDLDGFTLTDRLGFNQAEGHRARKCWRTLDSIVSKKKKELMQLMYAYNTFKDEVNIKKTIKLVKINEIVGTSNNTVSDQVREEPLHENIEEHDTYDTDLLLTKRVVILSRNNRQIGNQAKRNVKTNPPTTKRKLSKKERIKRFRDRIQHSRATKGSWGKGNKQIQNNKFASLRPCYVQMVREERVEEAYKKLCKDSTFNNNINIENKVNSVNNSAGLVQRCIAPPPEHRQLPKEERFLQNITNILLMRIIESEDRYKREMNFLKPILIVNEHNLRVINYSDEFSKNNIVYIVCALRSFPKSILVNEDFISAVELGYVKLVDAILFCRYVTGSMNLPFSRAVNYVNDHAYCSYRK